MINLPDNTKFRICDNCGHLQEAFDGFECIKCNSRTSTTRDCDICFKIVSRADYLWHYSRHWIGYEPKELIPKKVIRFWKNESRR